MGKVGARVLAFAWVVAGCGGGHVVREPDAGPGTGGSGGTSDADAAAPSGSSDGAVDANRSADAGADGGPSSGALAWRLLSAPAIGIDRVTTIWGSGASDIYLGTQNGNVFHLGRSGTWSNRQISVGQVTAIWGSGPADVYLAADMAASIFHSAGDDVWTSVDLPVAYPAVKGIWGSGSGNVYAVGGAGPIFHLTGSTWASELTFQMGRVTLYGAWGSGPNNVYSIKSGGDSVWRSTGTDDWAPESTNAPNLTAHLWGSGASDVYMTLAPYNLDMGPTQVIHSPGDGHWSSQLAVASYRLNALWGSGSDDVYAGGVHVNAQNVSDAAALYHTTGDGVWTAVPLDVPGLLTLDCIWGSSARDVYLAVTTNQFTAALLHGTR